MKRWMAISMGFALLVLVAAAPAAAQPRRCGMTVTGAVTLKRDLVCPVGHGVVLAPSSVLDCRGRRISGAGISGQYGVYVRGSGAVVRNCVVEQFEVGVRIRAAAGAVVERNTIRDNTRYGIEVTQGAVGARIQSNLVQDNGDEGIHLSGPVGTDAAHVLLDNTVEGNALEGIYLLDSDANLIAGNTVRDHGAAGIYVKRSERNLLAGNTLVNDPLQLVAGSTANVLRDIVIVGQALKLSQSPRNLIDHVSVVADRGRPSVAFDLSDSPQNAIVDSEALLPADYHIRARGTSTDNLFTRFSPAGPLRCALSRGATVAVTDTRDSPLDCTD